MNWIFMSWKEWTDYLKKASIHFLKGIGRIIFALVLGIVSLVYAAYKVVRDFVVRNPVFSLVVTCLVLLVLWFLTYVSMAARLKGAETQRDSISYELSKYKPLYEYHETVIINGDTIKF